MLILKGSKAPHQVCTVIYQRYFINAPSPQDRYATPIELAFKVQGRKPLVLLI